MDSSRRQTYKMQKQNYRSEKKRVAAELLATLQDPTVIVMADWLKVRGTLKQWTRLFCVLKPGLLLLYKSQKTDKHGHWVGTVLLSSCELIERPSKKCGFCFKLFHPLDQSIWAIRGPHGETIPAVTMPLPGSYLICRASNEDAGRCWMDALELSLRCSSLLMRTMNKDFRGSNHGLSSPESTEPISPLLNGNSMDIDHRSMSSFENNSHEKVSSMQSTPLSLGTAAADPTAHFEFKTGTISSSVRKVSVGGISLGDDSVMPKLDEYEAERHFSEEGLDDDRSDSDVGEEGASTDPDLEETPYAPSSAEVFGALGEDEQVEEVADENKSLIWSLMKQVRPGMDLSKVVLPTFILEPRSFLEKLADFYYHADLLKKAVNEDDPFERIKAVTKFYLSGFYKKPKGLKKPYNPVLGETFRCFWKHSPESDAKTFYIAEQVSHHPPVSAFYVTNRKLGYNITGSILAKSKFYGNSLSALMIGNARISLLSRGENYIVTLPYAHCKGLLVGTLTMELGGTVTIVSDRTSYSAELDFKLKPFFGGSQSMNYTCGKIKLGSTVVATLEGHWDSEIFLHDKKTGKTTLFWHPTPEVIEKRLKRFTVPVENQTQFESERLWANVTSAINACDQIVATDEKTAIEEAQRARAQALKSNAAVYEQKLFSFDPITEMWTYKHADFRPWDPQNDVCQYESDFIVKTRSRHRTPLVKTTSLLSGLHNTSHRARRRSSVVVEACSADVVYEESDDVESRGSDSPTKFTATKSSGGTHLKSVPFQELRADLRLLNERLSVLQYKMDTYFVEKSSSPVGSLPSYVLILAVFAAIQAAMIFVYRGGFGL